MQKLNDFVLWGGRYPGPKDYGGDFRQTPPPINEPDEHEIINKIYHEAEAEQDRLSHLQKDRQGGHSTGRIFSSSTKIFND